MRPKPGGAQTCARCGDNRAWRYNGMFIRTVEHLMAGMWEEGVLARYLLHPGLEARPRNVCLHARTKDRIRT